MPFPWDKRSSGKTLRNITTAGPRRKRAPDSAWKRERWGIQMVLGKLRHGVMPRGRFAELNRGNDRPGRRGMWRLAVPQELAIGRIAMRRMASSAQKDADERARPVVESLEGRRLLSGGSALGSHGAAAASTASGFSHKDTQFRYITPTGGHAQIKVVGVGNLAGTTVDSSGALELEYGATNVYSKIVGAGPGWKRSRPAGQHPQ